MEKNSFSFLLNKQESLTSKLVLKDPNKFKKLSFNLKNEIYSYLDLLDHEELVNLFLQNRKNNEIMMNFLENELTRTGEGTIINKQIVKLLCFFVNVDLAGLIKNSLGVKGDIRPIYIPDVLKPFPFDDETKISALVLYFNWARKKLKKLEIFIEFSLFNEEENNLVKKICEKLDKEIFLYNLRYNAIYYNGRRSIVLNNLDIFKNIKFCKEISGCLDFLIDNNICLTFDKSISSCLPMEYYEKFPNSQKSINLLRGNPVAAWFHKYKTKTNTKQVINLNLESLENISSFIYSPGENLPVNLKSVSMSNEIDSFSSLKYLSENHKHIERLRNLRLYKEEIELSEVSGFINSFTNLKELSFQRLKCNFLDLSCLKLDHLEKLNLGDISNYTSIGEEDLIEFETKIIKFKHLKYLSFKRDWSIFKIKFEKKLLMIQEYEGINSIYDFILNVCSQYSNMNKFHYIQSLNIRVPSPSLFNYLSNKLDTNFISNIKNVLISDDIRIKCDSPPKCIFKQLNYLHLPRENISHITCVERVYHLEMEDTDDNCFKYILSKQIVKLSLYFRFEEKLKKLFNFIIANKNFLKELKYIIIRIHRDDKWTIITEENKLIFESFTIIRLKY